jgi:UDP-N-acetylglucosamine 1-carboxyvinyltransferase
LTGAKVSASDLRAGAALILAALAADGETEITGIQHIDRGYVSIVDRLSEAGADIRRLEQVEEAEAQAHVSVEVSSEAIPLFPTVQVQPTWA